MKNRFFNFAIVTMAFMSTPLMVSCGGDDEETLKQENTSSSIDYVEPCFEWGASLEQVKTYMSGGSWQLKSDQYMLLYVNDKETCILSYMFRGSTPGLYYDMVQYIGYSESKLNALIAETEKRYKTSLKKQQEAVEGSVYTQYAGYATINGKNVGVAITSDFSTQISVIFAIPD